MFDANKRRMLTSKMQVNPKKSAPKVSTEIENETGKTCNPQTIRRVLYDASYHSRNVRKKPFISNTNRQKRLKFVKERRTLLEFCYFLGLK